TLAGWEGPMTSSERTDSPTSPAFAVESAVSRDGHETAELRREIEVLKLKLAQSEERQSATSEILRVISSSPTDLQPVLDAVAESVARLCGVEDAVILRVRGDELYVAAGCGPLPRLQPHESIPKRRDLINWRAILDKETIHVPDFYTANDAEFAAAKEYAARIGYRAAVATPMLREGAPIGVIFLERNKPGPFSEGQIELLKTFADQAVIAIENTRLFRELESRTQELASSVERLRSLSEVSQAVNSTLD